MKALIVEDSPQDLVFVQEMLEKTGKISLSKKGGYDVAVSIAEFTEYVNEKEYDFILLDLNLLDSAGLETVEKADEIRQISINSNTPIIVLTGTDDYAIAKEAIRAGAKDYLIKGEYDEKQLERAIRFATYSNGNPKRGKSWIKRMLA
jgi:CheY-like chemotaxis protein